MPNKQDLIICTRTPNKNYWTNAAIWFNKIHKDRQLKPKYISLKIKGRKQEDKRNTTHAMRFGIN